MIHNQVALVYDRVNKWGGAERLLLALKNIYPQAPLYASVYHQPRAIWAKEFRVIPSFLNHIPGAKIHHEYYPWLTPLAFESFDFSDFDLVISLTSAEAKGIITKPETFHLCYCLTPTRYWWNESSSYQPSLGFGNLDFMAKLAKRSFAPWLKEWDLIAARRPDYYLAISKYVQKKIKKYYHCDSEVIYPPINLEKLQYPADDKIAKNFKQGIKNNAYFLVVSRLVPYKRIDLVIEVFNKLNWPLKIIGSGVELTILKRSAGPNIEFLGELTDQELIRYYYHCQAVICPQEEDFGLVSLETQACGKPVISYRGGGALETIIESQTGEFFYPQTAGALYRTVLRFKPERYDTLTCQKNAQRFNQNLFEVKFNQKVRQIWQHYQTKN